MVNAFATDEISLVSQGNYYRPAEQQLADAYGRLNFDLPDSLCREEFHRDLELLKAIIPVRRDEYTFNNPAAKPAVVTVHPAPIVVTEVLLFFHSDEIWHMLDYKVFLHASEVVRLYADVTLFTTNNILAESTFEDEPFAHAAYHANHGRMEFDADFRRSAFEAFLIAVKSNAALAREER